MAIQLKDLKKKEIGEVVRELNFDDKVKLTMRFSNDKDFTSALSHLQEKQVNSALTKNKLSKANNAGESLTTGEAMLYLIGEYMITEWDVELSEGEIAPINGDNFTLLCSSIGDDDDNVEFMQYISKNFAEMSVEFRDQKESVKKKPLKPTVGTKKQAV